MHCTHEADTFARQCFDQLLFVARVADCAPGGIEASRQRSIRDDATLPNGADEVVLADDALSVPDQVFKQIEHLGCDNNHVRCALQFAPVGIQRVILKKKTQAAFPLRGHL
ncbi:hypothetical protein ABIF65_002686 [Bradyrhizobium japonicum]